MVIMRIPKICIIFAIAALFSIIFLNNLFDYESNYAFVQHVLLMDTIFPNSALGGRAINSPEVHQLAYWTIIFIEGLTSILCLVGGIRLVRGIKISSEQFNRLKTIAALGLTLGFLLMVFGFMVIGGEWFLMWQSEKWNGLNAALRISSICGLGYLILLQSD